MSSRAGALTGSDSWRQRRQGRQGTIAGLAGAWSRWITRKNRQEQAGFAELMAVEVAAQELACHADLGAEQRAPLGPVPGPVRPLTQPSMPAPLSAAGVAARGRRRRRRGSGGAGAPPALRARALKDPPPQTLRPLPRWHWRWRWWVLPPRRMPLLAPPPRPLRPPPRAAMPQGWRAGALLRARRRCCSGCGCAAAAASPHGAGGGAGSGAGGTCCRCGGCRCGGWAGGGRGRRVDGWG